MSSPASKLRKPSHAPFADPVGRPSAHFAIGESEDAGDENPATIRTEPSSDDRRGGRRPVRASMLTESPKPETPTTGLPEQSIYSVHGGLSGTEISTEEAAPAHVRLPRHLGQSRSGRATPSGFQSSGKDLSAGGSMASTPKWNRGGATGSNPTPKWASRRFSRAMAELETMSDLLNQSLEKISAARAATDDADESDGQEREPRRRLSVADECLSMLNDVLAGDEPHKETLQRLQTEMNDSAAMFEPDIMAGLHLGDPSHKATSAWLRGTLLVHSQQPSSPMAASLPVGGSGSSAMQPLEPVAVRRMSVGGERRTRRLSLVQVERMVSQLPSVTDECGPQDHIAAAAAASAAAEAAAGDAATAATITPLLSADGSEQHSASTESDPVAYFAPSPRVRNRTPPPIIKPWDVSKMHPEAVALLARPRVRDALAGLHNGSWDFDAFELDDASDGHSLATAGVAILYTHNLFERTGVDPVMTWPTLLAVEAAYVDVPYHNRRHAADVTYSLHCLLNQGGLVEDGVNDNPLDELAALLAAMVHDASKHRLLASVGHPGVNNDFLMRSEHPLALRYNDRSPLENHHAARGWELFNTDLDTSDPPLKAMPVGALPEPPPPAGLLGKFGVEDRARLRSTIIALILATDLKQHFDILADFQAHFAAGELMQTGRSAFGTVDRKQDGSGGSDEEQDEKSEGGGTPEEGGPLKTAADRMLALQLALKLADLGHTARPREVHLRWVEGLQEEFWRQGDNERSRGLRVMPMNERSSKIAKSQVGFFDFIILPLFRSYRAVFPLATPMLARAEANLKFWKKEDSAAKFRMAGKLIVMAGRSLSHQPSLKVANEAKFQTPIVAVVGAQLLRRASAELYAQLEAQRMALQQRRRSASSNQSAAPPADIEESNASGEASGALEESEDIIIAERPGEPSSSLSSWIAKNNGGHPCI